MNRLANSSSPYLLQHAHNPVDWFPWGPEALKKAENENKLLLVSIGYSACHWCHVMEHESFEDEKVAAVMNEYFVCIKVDREERPDIDQIYMAAVQLMTGRGGWPLNSICLPDQRPIYGGTYFRKNDWLSLLFNLADFYKNKPEEAEDYANKLTDGIIKFENFTPVSHEKLYTRADLEAIVTPWQRYFDLIEGGLGSAPKFPMPNNWQFLTRYAHLMQDAAIAKQVKLTLQKMAFGGIYDHIGGGFARYSVDGRWHVPHFEKMLYDNAQLLSLYAEAAVWAHDPLYEKVADEIIQFIANELSSPDGGFYSALDADSEGVEGKFYTFNKTEIEAVLGADAQVFCIYYNITTEGNWAEEETNVLFRNDNDEQLAEKLGLGISELQSKINSGRLKLLAYRSNRVRPGLDYKILASWNGLMLKGLADAFRAFRKPEYLQLALKNADFILNNLVDQAGRLKRIYSEKKLVDGDFAFLDDYANIIDAFIALYEVTFDEQWLIKAREFTEKAIGLYYDDKQGMFFYTASDDEQLIARKYELMDSVIPASNSVMANNLRKLSLFFDDENLGNIALQMLNNIAPQIAKYGSSYSNWAGLMLNEVVGLYEVAITGENFETVQAQFEKNYIPNKIILGGKKGILPLLQGRFARDTRIFVCRDKTCGIPVFNIEDALRQIK